MSEHESALDADQWMAVHATGVQAAERVHLRAGREGIEMQDQPFGSAKPVEWSAWFGTTARQKLAAVALHGHPAGFTWEDVDALRALVNAAADDFEDRSGTFPRGEQERARRLIERAESAIARMEALLPPENA